MNFKDWLILENKKDENLLNCLIRLKQSKPDCWEEFYSRFQPVVYKFLKRKTEYYEDVSQIVWKKLLNRFNSIRIENCKRTKNGFICNKEYKQIIKKLSSRIEGYLITIAINAVKTFYRQNFRKEYSPYQQQNINLFRTNRRGTENWMNNIPEKDSIDFIARKRGPGPTGFQRIYKPREISKIENNNIKNILEKIKLGEIKINVGKIPLEILVYALELKYGLKSSESDKFQKHHGDVSMKSKDIADAIKRKFNIRINNTSLRGALSKLQNHIKLILNNG